MILANHAQVEDLDVIRFTTTLNISPQSVTPFFYPLPSNYLRAYDVFYNVLGQVFTPSQWSLEEHDAAYTASGIANYPNRWATDMSQTAQPTAGSSPSMSFYPPPAVPLAVTVRYRPQTADITTPESSSSVPWFPNQLILLKELCMQLGDITDDSRTGSWAREVEDKMRKYLVMDDDKEGYSQTVKLDSRYFKSSRNLPPSKILGF